MLDHLIESVEESSALDRIAEPVGAAVKPATDPRLIKNALSGTWLGHRLHPLLTDVALGALMSATALDLLTGEKGAEAAQRLTGLGLAASLPTAVSGLSDWVDLGGKEQGARRVGVVHGLANLAGIVLYAGSLAARRSRRHGAARALSLAGLGTLSAGGFLGGHLSYVQGAGVDHTAFEHGPAEWTRAARLDDLPEREPRSVDVEGRAVLLYRSGTTVRALADHCNHAGCSLAEGEVRDGVVVCKCHGSTFRLDDGTVVRGPAASPQPVLDCRVTDGGDVEVRG